MEFITLPVSQIHENPNNWNKATHEALLLLEDKLEKKTQFKPLFVTPDDVPDSYTCLAGNKRIRIYKKHGVERVWVTILIFKQEEDNLWYCYRDGVKEMESFMTKQDAMKDWELVDREDYGETDMDAVANDSNSYSLDWSRYVMGTKPKKLSTRLNDFLMQDKIAESNELQCPECSHVADKKAFKKPNG